MAFCMFLNFSAHDFHSAASQKSLRSCESVRSERPESRVRRTLYLTQLTRAYAFFSFASINAELFNAHRVSLHGASILERIWRNGPRSRLYARSRPKNSRGFPHSLGSIEIILKHLSRPKKKIQTKDLAYKSHKII